MTQKKAVLIRKSDIDNTLATGPSEGKKLLEPLKAFSAANKVPVNILEDKNVVNDAEIHKHEADLWLCLEGEVTFTYGGELVDPWVKKNADGTTDDREWKSKEIKNGETALLKAGDWLWIPAGVPHKHDCPGIARLVIIKIPDKSE